MHLLSFMRMGFCLDAMVDNLQKGGFFVESGALDGELLSNTIYLEEHYNWNGLLIEVDPFYFLAMLSRNRRAYSVNACLSPTNKPSMVS